MLRVSDDGWASTERAADGPGTGIRGMRERALMVGGRAEIRRAAPDGTEVRLTVPVSAP